MIIYLDAYTYMHRHTHPLESTDLIFKIQSETFTIKRHHEAFYQYCRALRRPPAYASFVSAGVAATSEEKGETSCFKDFFGVLGSPD